MRERRITDRKIRRGRNTIAALGVIALGGIACGSEGSSVAADTAAPLCGDYASPAPNGEGCVFLGIPKESPTEQANRGGGGHGDDHSQQGSGGSGGRNQGGSGGNDGGGAHEGSGGNAGGGSTGGGGNGGQFGGGRDPAVVEACTDLASLLRNSQNGPIPEIEAKRTIRPWNHLQFRRNANLNADAHLIYTDVFLTSPVDTSLLIADLLLMKRDCAKAGFH